MKTRKSISFLSIALTLLVMFTLLPLTAGAVGVADGIPFTDVPANAWYYDDVKTAFESGLINGKTDSTFAPNDSLTYAEAVKLAACMHQMYTTGAVTLTNGSTVWYQTYVDYAKQNHIISRDYLWTVSATRAGYLEIFAEALPYAAFSHINTVFDNAIRDVPMSHPNADAIYKMYRAGIIEGVDAERNCDPTAEIRRSEVAAVITRMMDPSTRKQFTALNVWLPLSDTWVSALFDDPDGDTYYSYLKFWDDETVDCSAGYSADKLDYTYRGDYTIILEEDDSYAYPASTIIFYLELWNADNNYAGIDALVDSVLCVYTITMEDFDQMTLIHLDEDWMVGDRDTIDYSLLLG